MRSHLTQNDHGEPPILATTSVFPVGCARDAVGSVDCRNGSACIVENGTQTCHPYCNLASSACASGLSCVGLNPALHVTGTDVGVCI